MVGVTTTWRTGSIGWDAALSPRSLRSGMEKVTKGDDQLLPQREVEMALITATPQVTAIKQDIWQQTAAVKVRRKIVGRVMLLFSAILSVCRCVIYVIYAGTLWVVIIILQWTNWLTV